MKKIVALIFLFISCIAYAQLSMPQILWATEVLDVSSDNHHSLDFSSRQILGAPNVYPNGGVNSHAWRPRKKTGANEFIIVKFEKSILLKQIVIAETENPGAIKAVYGYDNRNKEYKLAVNNPVAINTKSRLLHLYYDKKPIRVNTLKVVLDCSISVDYNAIDAIGISDSEIPIESSILIAQGINKKKEGNKLGKNINTEYKEHNPIISHDGKRMYFSRQFHPGNVGGAKDPEDIWMSELDEATGQWLPAINVGPPLNTKGSNFISSITIINGREEFLLGNRYDGKRQIKGVSKTLRNGNKFSTPTPLEIDDEYNTSSLADFFLAPDGATLLMAVERDDSYGKRDLYVSFKKKTKSTWSTPKNLGIDINTVGDDEGPFLSEDMKTLYFSTDGFSGYGGNDIFVSRRLDDTWVHWSPPENMGPGLNKESDEEYFTIPASGNNVYFNRDNDVYSVNVEELFSDTTAEIYSSVKHLENQPAKEQIVSNTNINVPAGAVKVASYKDINLKGSSILDSSSSPIEGAIIKLVRATDNKVVNKTTTNQNGEFSFTLRSGLNYLVSAEKEGFLSESHNIDLTKFSEDSITTSLSMVPIKVGEKIILNSLFFAFDSDVITTSSFAELDRIITQLKSKAIKKLKIVGHTDNLGSEAYNLSLSNRRAKKVMKYFVDSGIAQESLQTKAYGEAHPRVPNTTEAGRTKNRRVEMLIIE